MRILIEEDALGPVHPYVANLASPDLGVGHFHYMPLAHAPRLDDCPGAPTVALAPEDSEISFGYASSLGGRAGGRSRLDRVEAIRGRVRQADPAVKEWWLTVEGNLQRYFRSDGKERWRAATIAREASPYEELFAGYDEASHQAVPGLLTALGLLGAFIALLMGLAHLEYTEKAVTGLKELIKRFLASS